MLAVTELVVSGTQCTHSLEHHLDLTVEFALLTRIVFEVLFQPSNLLLFVSDRLVEGLQLLRDPLVPVLLGRELVPASLLRVQLLATLFSQGQTTGKTRTKQTWKRVPLTPADYDSTWTFVIRNVLVKLAHRENTEVFFLRRNSVHSLTKVFLHETEILWNYTPH